jgi:hypothetical protein
MSIRLSNLPLAADSVVPSGFFAVADLTDLSSTQGMGRTLNIPVSGIYDISINKNIISKTNSYSLSKHDYKSTILFDNSSDVELVVLPNSIEKINPAYNISIVRNNIGNVHIVPSGSVQIYSDSGFYLKSRYSLSTLTKITDNSWILQGDLTTEPNTGTPQVCYTISGSIISNINGRYQYYGLDPQNNPVYKHLSTEYYILWYNNCWLISNTSDGFDAWHNYYTHSCSGVKDLFPKGSWNQSCGGDYSFESIMANEATC